MGKLKSKRQRYFVAGNDGLHGLKEASNIQECTDAYDSFSNENPDFIKVPEVALDFDELAEFRRKFASIKEHLSFFLESYRKDTHMWITCLTIGKTIST